MLMSDFCLFGCQFGLLGLEIPIITTWHTDMSSHMPPYFLPDLLALHYSHFSGWFWIFAAKSWEVAGTYKWWFCLKINLSGRDTQTLLSGLSGGGIQKLWASALKFTHIMAVILHFLEIYYTFLWMSSYRTLDQTVNVKCYRLIDVLLLYHRHPPFLVLNLNCNVLELTSRFKHNFCRTLWFDMGKVARYFVGWALGGIFGILYVYITEKEKEIKSARIHSTRMHPGRITDIRSTSSSSYSYDTQSDPGDGTDGRPVYNPPETIEDYMYRVSKRIPAGKLIEFAERFLSLTRQEICNLNAFKVLKLWREKMNFLVYKEVCVRRFPIDFRGSHFWIFVEFIELDKELFSMCI